MIDYQNFLYDFSSHALKRLTQRGIKLESLDILYDHALLFYAGKSDMALWVGEKSISKLGISGKKLSDIINIAVVVSPDGRIKTIMRCRKPPKYWKRAS